MGTATPHALGRSLKFFASDESTYGTFTKPVAADAMKILSCAFDYSEERKPRMDARQTRSLLERFTGRREASWSVEKYLIPSGTAGTPPDDHLFWKNALGSYTNTPASDDYYGLSKADTDFGSLTLTRHMNDVFMEALYGCWVDECTINVSGTEEAKVSFSGGAKDYVATGYSKANGAGAASSTLVNRTATSPTTNFMVNSVVAIDADTNSGAGYKITAISGANMTLETTATWDDQDPITPFTPAETTAGSPLWGLTGYLNWDGVALPVTAFDVTIKNGIKGINDEHAANSVSDYILGYREVTGNISFRLRRDYAQYFLQRQTRTTTVDMECKIGTTAGKTVIVKVQYAELDFSSVEIPEAEEATVTVPYTCLGNDVTAGNDDTELYISFE